MQTTSKLDLFKLAACVAAVCIAVTLPGYAQKGKGGGGSSQTVDLLLTFNFDGAISTISAPGSVVECTSKYCEFTNNSIGPVSFLLPGSCRDLINSTDWHATPLDADTCYPGLTLAADNIFLRRTLGSPTWHAKVGGTAKDMEGDDRRYTFNFSGGCDATGCDPLPPSAGDPSSYSGDLLSIWSEGPDQQLGVPCRCTMSNTPGCPDETAGISTSDNIIVPPITLTVQLVE